MQTINIVRIQGEHALDLAARLLAGRLNLAKKLNVTVGAIGNWKVRGVPIEHCNAIERATHGAVTRCDLRPDDWHTIWPELVQAHANTTQTATENVAEQGA